MSYHRPIDPVLQIVIAVTSLPNVVDEDSGKALEPLTRGAATELSDDVRRALPRQIALRGFSGPAETITIPRPVEIKAYTNGQWVPVGELRATDPPEDPLILTPTSGYFGIIKTGADWTRIAIVAAGPVVGGVVTFELQAQMNVLEGPR